MTYKETSFKTIKKNYKKLGPKNSLCPKNPLPLNILHRDTLKAIFQYKTHKRAYLTF